MQAALNEAAANSSITEIWVAAGVYRPSVQHDPNEDRSDPPCQTPGTCVNDCDDPARTKTFQLIAGVSMYGGFLGNATGGGETSKTQADPFTNLTILSGDINDDDDQDEFDDNAYHVVYYYFEYDPEEELPDFENWEINGFVIEGGIANGGSQDVKCENPGYKRNAFGGGMLINVFNYGRLDDNPTEPAAPRVRRCVFRNNNAHSGGGGYACIDAGGYFEDCEFRDNTQTAEVSDIVPNNGVQPGGGGAAVRGPLRMIRTKLAGNVGTVGDQLSVHPASNHITLVEVDIIEPCNEEVKAHALATHR